LSLLFLLLAARLLAGCHTERPTQIKVEGGETPVFVLSGSGKLASFSVYLVPPSPEKMDKPFSEQVPVWQITAKPDFLHGRPIEKIQELTYGLIPAGYNESFPENGGLPRTIEPEKAYFFDCNTIDAPTAAGFFRVHDGKAIPVQVKTPCWGTQNGKWVAVPCIDHP
jgi:hypothetical protein